MSDAFKPLLAKLAEGAVLDAADAEAFFAACLRGEPTPAQIASAVTAMRVRGETVGEIAAFATAMRATATMLDHPHDVIDVCGAGGTGISTVNTSTAAALVAAGAGLKIAKHGGRSATRRSGSADVLAALGVNVEATLEQERRALDEANICFLFAPAHNGAMRHVLPIRRELGFRTIFNLLGPLSNPAGARRQVMGVFDARWVEPLARVLGALGAERAWVVHGEGLDDITTTGVTEVAEWRDGQVRRFQVTPESAGLPRARLDDLRGGEPADNARALRAVLEGRTGPYRDMVLLNAAAAFVVADRAEGLTEGVALAAQSIDSGAAARALDALIAASNS